MESLSSSCSSSSPPSIQKEAVFGQTCLQNIFFSLWAFLVHGKRKQHRGNTTQSGLVGWSPSEKKRETIEFALLFPPFSTQTEMLLHLTHLFQTFSSFHLHLTFSLKSGLPCSQSIKKSMIVAPQKVKQLQV